jgi:hypothetical protein
MIYLLTAVVLVQGIIIPDQVCSVVRWIEMIKESCSLTYRQDLNPNAHARLWDHQLIPQKLFQLTEWVHKLITSAQSDAQTTIHEILPVYNKCLDWYNNFFFFLNADGSRTPFVLFVQ